MQILHAFLCVSTLPEGNIPVRKASFWNYKLWEKNDIVTQKCVERWSAGSFPEGVDRQMTCQYGKCPTTKNLYLKGQFTKFIKNTRSQLSYLNQIIQYNVGFGWKTRSFLSRLTSLWTTFFLKLWQKKDVDHPEWSGHFLKMIVTQSVCICWSENETQE